MIISFIENDLRARKKGKTWQLEKGHSGKWKVVGSYPDLPSLLGAIVRRHPDTLFPVGTETITVPQLLQRFDEMLVAMSTFPEPKGL